jgi:hypothetical protein
MKYRKIRIECQTNQVFLQFSWRRRFKDSRGQGFKSDSIEDYSLDREIGKHDL